MIVPFVLAVAAAFLSLVALRQERRFKARLEMFAGETFATQLRVARRLRTLP